jgi:hypothetical protein
LIRWVLDSYIRLVDLLCYVGVNTYMIETQLASCDNSFTILGCMVVKFGAGPTSRLTNGFELASQGTWRATSIAIYNKRIVLVRSNAASNFSW